MVLRSIVIVSCAAGLLAFDLSRTASAHGPLMQMPLARVDEMPPGLRVEGDLPELPDDVVDLKFRDVFALPIGPRGLDLSERFTALDGRRVRLVGYMVALLPPTADAFMFSPLPVELAVHDEGLADDIPASTLYVRLPRFSAASAVGVAAPGIPQMPGLLHLTGTLSTQPYADPITGRIFPGTLVLDAEPRRAVLQVARSVAERSATTVAVDTQMPRVLPGARR